MNRQNSSYKQIVRSTTIFGGVQVVNVLLGIARTKLVALLLGKVGVGMIGICQNIIDLIRSVSGLGIETGGIRDIASSSNDAEERVYKISVFKWWVALTSILGLVICLIFSYPISVWMFGDGSYTLPVAFLSLAVFFTTLSFGQTIVLQGMRMVGAMAKASLIGNVISTIVSIGFYYFFGMKGIVPSFIIGSIILLLCANIYYRKLHIPKIRISNREALRKGFSNFQLGLFIVTASIINYASMLIIRSFLNNEMDLGSVGIFQAAWIITNNYLMLILKSMGTDYFPRLCSIGDSRAQMCKLVNEQTYIVLVVAIPVVVIMLLFSKVVLSLLYSGEFTSGELLLQWQIVGSFLKVLSWPLAFIMLAKGRGKYYLFSEVLFFAVYLGASFVLFPSFGLLAAGIGYFIAYVVYLTIVFLFGVKLCHFKWTKENIMMCFIGIFFILVAVSILRYFDNYIFIAGGALSVIVIAYATVMLNRVFDIRELFNRFKK